MDDTTLDRTRAGFVRVRGAGVHNLKNVDLDLPRISWWSSPAAGARSPGAAPSGDSLIILLQVIRLAVIFSDMPAWKIGDKLRIRSGPLIGHRGVVCGIEPNKKISVRLEDGSVQDLETSALTNFSAAARKAWKTMPKREVGRPRGTKTNDRVSVTLRIDRRLWERFRMQENAGVIGDRSTEIEKALAVIVSRATGA